MLFDDNAQTPKSKLGLRSDPRRGWCLVVAVRLLGCDPRCGWCGLVGDERSGVTGAFCSWRLTPVCAPSQMETQFGVSLTAARAPFLHDFCHGHSPFLIAIDFFLSCSPNRSPFLTAGTCLSLDSLWPVPLNFSSAHYPNKPLYVGGGDSGAVL